LTRQVSPVLALILNLAAAPAAPTGKSAAVLDAKKNPQEAFASEGLLSVVAGVRNQLDLLLSG